MHRYVFCAFLWHCMTVLLHAMGVPTDVALRPRCLQMKLHHTKWHQVAPSTPCMLPDRRKASIIWLKPHEAI